MDFYQGNIDDLLAKFGTDAKNGLTDADVERNRAQYGSNMLKSQNTRGV